MGRRKATITVFLSIAILAVFLAAGLLIYDDYGASVDEYHQIEGGHVVWKFVCQKLSRPVPSAISDAPELETYRNRFYGQAATFPTVLVEAVRGFSLDSSVILRIRHLWNFLSYFAGLCCFCALVRRVFENEWCAPVGLLFMILLPRIFGDIFYNDRDTMLIAWFSVSLWMLVCYMDDPRWYKGLLCAFSFAVTFNTRMFGLFLFCFALQFLRFPGKKKNVFILCFLSVIFWILITPVYWEEPVKKIFESILHLSAKQRYLDTNNETSILFLGKPVNETELPRYYVPLYILLTTPLTTTLISCLGVVVFVRGLFSRQTVPQKAERYGVRDLMGKGMLVMLFPTMVIIGIVRPSLYNGWRHFYFLYLPVVWMAVEGAGFLLKLPELNIFRLLGLFCTFFSFAVSAGWIIKAHPYQGIYFTPLVRKQAAGQFERDYWDLSTRECAEYLLDNANNIAVHVTYSNLIQTVLQILPRGERERLHTYPYKPQPYPMEYLIHNYDNQIGNDVSFSYYAPVYAVERDGMKLSEVFQRSHSYEMDKGSTVQAVISLPDGESADSVTDGDYETAWTGAGETELVMILDEEHTLHGIELFLIGDWNVLPEFRLSYSTDGSGWNAVDCHGTGTNGLGFDPVRTGYLKIECDIPNMGIREILLYGS